MGLHVNIKSIVLLIPISINISSHKEANNAQVEQEQILQGASLPNCSINHEIKNKKLQ
jgi:hypothetical protein